MSKNQKKFLIVIPIICLFFCCCTQSESRWGGASQEQAEYYGHLFSDENLQKVSIDNDLREILPHGDTHISEWFSVFSGDKILFSFAAIGNEREKNTVDSSEDSKPKAPKKRPGKKALINMVVAQWSQEKSSFIYDDLPCSLKLQIEDSAGEKVDGFSITFSPVKDRLYQQWHEHTLSLGRWVGKKIRLSIVANVSGSSVNKLCITNPLLFNSIKPGGAENSILISLDTLRSDHLGCYGYPRNISPEIDKFSKSSLLYARALTPCTWTLPAHMSLFTGVPASIHRVLRHDSPPISSKFSTLAELYRKNGYVTGGFTEGGFVGPDWGMDRGFERYDSFALFDEHITNTVKWIDSRKGNLPFFIFLHTYEVHFPYNSRHPGFIFTQRPSSAKMYSPPFLKKSPSKAELREIINAYDDGIRSCDRFLGQFLRALQERDLSQNSSIILFSDHGEEFMEHGGYKHGNELYRETLEVPLLVKLADRSKPGVIQKTVSLQEIYSTLLLNHHIPIPDGVELIPLPETWERQERPKTFISDTLKNQPRVRIDIDGQAKIARKEEHNDTVEQTYFNIQSDPQEETPLSLESDMKLITQWSQLFGGGQFWCNFSPDHHYEVAITVDKKLQPKVIYQSPGIADQFRKNDSTLTLRLSRTKGLFGLYFENVPGAITLKLMMDGKSASLSGRAEKGKYSGKSDMITLTLPLETIEALHHEAIENIFSSGPFNVLAYPELREMNDSQQGPSTDTVEKLKQLGYLSD